MGKHTLKIFGAAAVCLFLLTALLFKPGAPEAGGSEKEFQTAEALEVRAITVVPRLAAYGQARPSRAWAAVVENASRLQWISPKIYNGEYVEQGEELLHLLEGDASVAERQRVEAKTIIRAPFKGLVSVTEGISPGEIVASGKTILTLDALDKAEITIGLNNDKLAMLANADKPLGDLTADIRDSLAQAWLEVAPEGESERLPARLSARPVSLNPGTGLVEASIIIDNPSSPGALHQVFISGPPQESQVVIPRRAVHDGEVFVVDHKSRVKKRPVTVKYTLDNYAVIGQGLEPGETLLIGEIGALKPGGHLNVQLDDKFYLAAENELGQTDGSQKIERLYSRFPLAGKKKPS